jgi:endonuclease/exonuclease/phosphatase family metal-dependent hydrolase
MLRGILWWVLVFLLAVGCSDNTGGDGEPDGGMEDASEEKAGDGDPGTDRAADGGDVNGDVYDDGDVGEEPDAGGDDGGGDDAGGDDGGGDDGSVGDDGGEPAKFSVLTINLKHPITGMDEAVQRLAIVADAINDRQPDVVALQEVVKDGAEPSLAEQLAGMTGYEWIWEKSYFIGLFDEGLAILSRWPIVWSDSVELPHVDMIFFYRRALGGRVQSPHGDIQLFCTHMTTSHDETIEADQALAVYQFMQANPSPLAGFLAGDMNSEPDDLAMRFLRGEAEHEGVTGNLIDSWMIANPGDVGYTHDSLTPDKRIDYIYLAPGTEKSAEVDSCELMFTEEVGGLYASDHLGVLCEYTLDP